MYYTTKILLVEHDSYDLEMIHRELKKSELNYAIEIVQDEQNYLNALEEFAPDIILSDYSLPAFSGLRAFELKQDIIPNIPFIFVSGTIGEEKSIELIKNGLTDYVLKDKIFSLVPKIQRALIEYEERASKRKAELTIEFERNNLKALINNTYDLMWSVDINFNLITSNQSFDEMVKKLSGKSILPGTGKNLKSINNKLLKRFKAYYERAFLGEIFTEIEYASTPMESWAEISFYPIRQGNKIIGTACHSRDITNIKKTEKQIIINEKRFRSLVESGADSVAILTAEGRPIYVSPTIKKVLGYTEEEALQLDLFSLFHKDDIVWALDVWQQILVKPGVPIAVRPCRMLHKNGNWRWLEGTLTNLLGDDSINGIVDNFRDVTLKKEAEDSLLLTQFAIDNAGDAVFWMTVDAKIIDVNDAACVMLGYTKKELLDSSIPNIDPLYNSTRWAEHFRELRKKGSLFFETTQRAKDGRLIPVEIRANYVKYDGIEFNCAFSRDITERRKADEKIKKSEISLREAQAIGHIGNWEIDVLTNKHTWSDELYHIYGIEKNEVEPSTELFLSFMQPSDVTIAKEQINKVYDVQQPTSYNFKFIRKDGIKRYGYIERKLEFDSNNRLIRVYGIIQDITERKEVEKKLRKSEAFNRGVIDSLSSHIAVLNDKGTIVTINDAWKQFALENGETSLQRTGAGSNYFDVCKKSAKDGNNTAAKALQGIKDVLTEKKSFFYLEYECSSPQKNRWFAMRVVKFKSETPMVIVAHENITELRKAELERDTTQEANIKLHKVEQELNKALIKEKDLSELKSRFVSMASHEFRTPLTTMMSSLSLVNKYAEKNDTESQIKHIIKIKKSINNLTDILNDFLSVSKLEEGKMENNPEEANLKNFIADIILELQLMANDGQVIVQKYQVKEIVSFDKKLLRNILFNLLSNALKFSKANGIIEVKVEESHNAITIAVKDCGIGISKEDQKHLFERFFRGRNATHIQGTGLGLNIVAKYTELMNATLTLKSIENEGTIVAIKIPQ